MNIVLRVLCWFFSSIFLLFSFLFYPSQGYCLGGRDPINIKNDTLPFPFKTSISFGGNRRTGTFSQEVLTAGLATEIKTQDLEFITKMNYIFSNTNGLTVANDWFVLSSINYKNTLKSKITPSIFYEYRKNIQYKISYSHKIFLGVQIHPFYKKKNYLWYAGLGYELTRYKNNIFENSNKIDAKRNFEIAVIHIKNNRNFFNEKFFLGYDVFYIQSFRESQDFTFGIVADINIPIKKRILIGIKYDFRLRNVHLIDTARLNDLLSFNFTLNLGK